MNAPDVIRTGPRAQASPLQVGGALAAVVLAAVVIFSLGVLVGTGAVESVPPTGAPPAALPTENLVPVPPPSSYGTEATIPPERLTFYDRLSAKGIPAPIELPSDQPLPPAPPQEKAIPAALEPAAAPKTVSAAVPAADGGAPAARIRALVGKGPYAVQVAATGQSAAAEAAASRFRKQGFDVATAAGVVKGKTWYRVRVGSFPDQQAAAKAAGLFRSAFGVDGMAVRSDRAAGSR